MQQLDWVGDTKPKKARDIGNTRPTTAEEKARLCLELGELLKRIPASIKSGGTVQTVRQFKEAHKTAEKVVGNKRATVEELKYQIRAIARWHE